jgi:hypothetical protein
VSWDQRIFDPIKLPGGKKLITLRDAALYITKLPKAEHDVDEWQAAMEALLLVCRTWTDDVCPDWRDAGAKSARRARVQSRTERPALGRRKLATDRCKFEGCRVHRSCVCVEAEPCRLC